MNDRDDRDDQDDRDEGNPRYLASVNVYGAGIAGLTAAHELMVRGFKVRIVECDVAMDPRGDEGPAIGGLARNQYLEAPKLLSPRWWEINEEAVWTATAPAADTHLPVRFDKGSSELSEGAAATLRAAAGAIDRKYGAVSLEIASHAADGSTKKQNRDLSAQRAETVKSALAGALPGMRDRHFHLLTGAEAPALAADAVLSATEQGTVTVRAFKVILPGEHGFHFFPGYYRHLFDTMRRTPIVDAEGNETGRTVYDNLTVAPHQSYAVQLPHSRTVDETLDYQQFSLRIQRYLTTCPARRGAEYEDISWWQYLTGWSPATGTSLYVYSPQFAEGVKFSGRVLAAFDAQWGDARTNGDTFIQLELDSWIGKQTFDGILNGGETTCWFEPWRRYLISRGVEFVSGVLESFDLVEGKLRALVVPPGEQTAVPDRDADYYVSATDVVNAEKVTARLPKIGVPAGLNGYTTIVPPCPLLPVAPMQEVIVRDPLKQPGLRDWDRLQTLSGIQFFFTNEFNLNDGYMYFTDAVWALSSINPQQFWSHRPTLEKDGYIGLMSVDIGNWRIASKTPSLLGKAAWECTREEIAQEVWRQVTTSLLREQRDLVLPQPVWYNLDQNIVFGNSPESTPQENRTPYQIPIVGDWKNRPAGNPWDPTPTLPNLDLCYPHLHQGLWQARHGGYLVHWDKLVFAGTYMRTFTRMTTMESANESARNAVNAIIDHVVEKRYSDEILARVMPPSAPAPLPNEALNSNFTRDFQRPSPVGDYCRIWNPEQNELPSLQAERDADALRFALGQPHIYDTLGVELPLSAASYQRAILHGWWPPKPSPAEVAAQAAAVAAALPSTGALFESLARIRAALEEDAPEQMR
jgi:OmpA family